MTRTVAQNDERLFAQCRLFYILLGVFIAGRHHLLFRLSTLLPPDKI
jgi:hypothetical protein